MGRITGVRGDVVVRETPFVVDDEGPLTPEFIRHAIRRIYGELDNIARMTFDESRRVDEYQTILGNVTSLEVLPDYEMSEVIVSIVIGAPPFSVCQLQLGNRYLQITIDQTGLRVITPVAYQLDRRDRRILTLVGSSFGNPAVATGTVAAPGAAATITSLALPAGTYLINWTVSPGAGAAHANNFQLLNGATQVAISINATTNISYPQTAILVTVPAGGGTVSIASILADAGTTYSAQLVATPQGVTTGPVIPGPMTLSLHGFADMA
jgi:hypothetical protein